MAKVCNTCLATVPTTKRGKCRNCNLRTEKTRRPPSSQRYPPEYLRNRKLVLERDPWCYWCGRPSTTADHLQPISQGGAHTLDNLVGCCAPCNASRGNRNKPKHLT